ncbi:MAG: hypothetical protein JXA67_06660 [Micromonosporaceae bacterium]|nr:hypothetical protein [Micromonosporaceae bacterium]
MNSHREPSTEVHASGCPCGSGHPYPACCGLLHSDQAAAASAEVLMRSRFSAYVRGDTSYLLRTWHPTTRPKVLALDPSQHWVRLEVLATSAGGVFDTAGTVEFRVSCRHRGRLKALRERSSFVREGGRWFYLAGVPVPD